MKFGAASLRNEDIEVKSPMTIERKDLVLVFIKEGIKSLVGKMTWGYGFPLPHKFDSVSKMIKDDFLVIFL